MKALAAGIGALMILVGVVWTLQGLGYLGGSSMTGDEKWAIIGPAVAGIGVALAWVAFRGRRSAD
ncbi:hypothetical protein [Nocardioides sp.]|uniref:hypothetical protein n=1 Tax=Nocardioides sp. TaxID=35761 RepID=UPI002D7E5BA4|nr:hypothetical protein [Nocardioides sp.]HET8960427.1 hypothetical protein [Nocardioides sp.]